MTVIDYELEGSVEKSFGLLRPEFRCGPDSQVEITWVEELDERLTLISTKGSLRVTEKLHRYSSLSMITHIVKERNSLTIDSRFPGELLVEAENPGADFSFYIYDSGMKKRLCNHEWVELFTSSVCKNCGCDRF
jgi:hypothetical protein